MTKNSGPTEDELDRAYKLGESSGLEIASGFLMETAAGYFKRKSDDEAGLLRRLAMELEAKAKERHPGERKT